MRIGTVAGVWLGMMALVAGGSPRAADEVINACVGKQGSVRIVDPGVLCMKGETAVQWNRVGPQGPAGPAGPAGPPGPQGEPGAPGAGLDSLEGLAGLPCGSGASAGTVGVALNPFSNQVSLACTPNGQFQLAVAVKGAGSVSSNPPGIGCGAGQGDCTQGFAGGTLVTLTESPGQVGFAGWGGACSGADPVCQVTLDQARQVTAVFNPVLTISLTTAATERVHNCIFGFCAYVDIFTESKARVTVVDAETDTPLGVCNADTTATNPTSQFALPTFHETRCPIGVPIGHRVRLHADDSAVVGGILSFVQWGQALCDGVTAADCNPTAGISANQVQTAVFF